MTAAFQYTFREDDLFPTGLVTTDLSGAFPALGEWIAWAGGAAADRSAAAQRLLVAHLRGARRVAARMRLYDYAASGNCFKVRLLLGLLGRPYERVPIDIFAGDTLTDAYAEINPLRETPVLELDSGERLAQSSAILWYLAEGTPLLPEDALGRAQVAQWLSFEQERVMGGLGNPRFRLLTGRPSAGIESRLPPGAARWRCSTRTSPAARGSSASA